MRIVFFGTPEFAAFALEKIIDSGSCDVAAVVTMPDKLAGRGHRLIQSAVKETALAHGLPLLQPEKLKAPEFVNQLKQFDADLFVVIAFRMLPEVVWAMPPKGTFNLHASLLPAYRGAAPINWAIINGEKRTGVTTFFLKHEIDTGDIIDQEEIDILPTDNVGTLHDKLMELGAKLTVKTITEIAQKGSVPTRPQTEIKGKSAQAPKIFTDTCKINWDLPTRDIHNLVRGLSPYPGAWTPSPIGPIKVFETRPATPQQSTGLLAETGDGQIEILSLQLTGQRRMGAKDFLNGLKQQLVVSRSILAHDFCADGAKTGINLLVPSVNLRDIVYTACAPGAHGGYEQGDACTDVGGMHVVSPERLTMVLSDDNGTVRVTQHNLGPHVYEPVYEKEAALKHFLMDED